MDGIVLFLNAIDRAIAYLRGRETESEARSKRIDAVWVALRKAATITRIALADKPSGRIDNDQKAALATSWNSVGIALRRLKDQEAIKIADVCFAKADFWADPKGWKKGLRGDVDIELDRLESLIERRLKTDK